MQRVMLRLTADTVLVGILLFLSAGTLAWGHAGVLLAVMFVVRCIGALAVSRVRLQTERSHAVCDSGPYSIVRHPFYAADPLILVGLSLWLGS